MSKEDKFSEYESKSKHEVAELRYNDVAHLTGKLLTLIDATFTDVEQRRASKQLFKETLWTWFHNTYRDQGYKTTGGIPTEHTLENI